VIVHGGPGGNNYAFERTIGPRLEQLTTVIYYEQRGCGRSEAPAEPEAYSLPLLVADLEALRQAWRQERIIPLGYSFGGEVALEYALAHPDRVSKLIVQAPGVGDADQIAYVQLAGFTLVAREEDKNAVQQILAADGSPQDRLAKVWQAVDRETVDRFLFHNRDAARLNRQLWQESGLVNTGQMERALARQPRSSPSLQERLPLVRVPTLVIVGLYDRNSGVDVNRDVATLIPHAALALFAQVVGAARTAIVGSWHDRQKARRA
jgi:proline iminopeptidase